jgi:hypothetical protein
MQVKSRRNMGEPPAIQRVRDRLSDWMAQYYKPHQELSVLCSPGRRGALDCTRVLAKAQLKLLRLASGVQARKRHPATGIG